MKAASRELDLLLGGMSMAAFMRDHWDKRSLHVPGPADRLAAIYDVGRWQRGEYLRDVKAAGRDRAGRQVELSIDAAQAPALFDAGLTICADVSGDPTVAPFLAGFRAAFRMPGGPAFAKLYASNDGGGFAPHFDRYHVFVLQIEGRKRWRYSPGPALPSPLAGGHLSAAGEPVWASPRAGEPILTDDGETLRAPDLSKLESVLLEPGHVLYLPPGAWHATAADGPSIAISVSPPRATVFELASRALQDILEQRPDWRRDIVAPADAPAPLGKVPRAVEEALDERLGELRAVVGELDRRLVQRLWRLNVEAGSGTGREAVDGQADSPDKVAGQVAIGPEDVLLHAPGAPFEFLVAPSPAGGEEIFFYRRRSEWALPRAALPFVTALARHPRFRAADAQAWQADLSWEDVHDLLAQLVAIGVLEPSAMK